ncbi:MAG: ribonuclease P protein subunit [Nanoarchaeota archaeon]
MCSIKASEFIGLNIKIINSKNKSIVGLKGKVVDETKNTITIEHNGKMKRLIKNQITLKVCNGNKLFEIEGKLLVGRPEDRIKK